MNRFVVCIAAASAFFAVAAGAFAAHGLKARLSPEMLEVFRTGAQYQMYHALALFALAGIGPDWPRPAFTVAVWAFIIGTILFSGSLYALALTGIRILGAITPFGGVGFLIGWSAIFIAALQKKRRVRGPL
jgi:uncharacterized membrane protein YgdD (TMEM256/DUF423 family)